MRLAQIARKVGITSTDVKRFLESEFELNIGNEPNYKLNDNQINAVLDKFPVPEPVIIETTAKTDENVDVVAEENNVELDNLVQEVNEIPSEPITVAAEINPVEDILAEEVNGEEIEIIENTEIDAELVKTEITSESELVNATMDKELDSETTEEKLEETTEEITEEKTVEINYDTPENIDEEDSNFKEVPVDRSAETIKAPAVKLDGLKVLGKIELPEKKKIEPEVTEEEIAKEEADAIALLDAAMESQAQDIKTGKIAQPKAKAVQENLNIKEDSESEYKDSRGIYHFSPTQKENRLKSSDRITLEKKKEAEKIKKRKHYEEVVKTHKPVNTVKAKKIKEKKTVERKIKVEKKNTPPPQGLWARFKHWLND